MVKYELKNDTVLLTAFCFSVDVHQLQTFTHIALMTQCTDGSSVDLLTALDQVGMKLAPLIFDLQKTGGLNSFMECCRALRSDHLSGICEKVVSKVTHYGIDLAAMIWSVM